MWGGGFKGFKGEKKRVTFAYLPNYKEDEDEAAHIKRKLAKDLPMEANSPNPEENL